jgi:CHAD domain-containing protein
MKWIGKTIETERRRLERARRRFIDSPGEEHLHDLRTRARRLRSFLEAVRELQRHPELLRRLKRAAALTDAARDAAILFTLLDNAVDETERVTAEPLLEQLRERERVATSEARRLLRKIDFA